MKATRIPKDHIDDAWEYLGPVLERALDKAHGERTLDDLRDDCIRGDAQLWFRGESALVTQLIVYPRYKAARLLVCAGRMQDAIPGFADVKEWAQKEGCKAMEICGRRGWVRALGMDETYTVSRVEI